MSYTRIPRIKMSLYTTILSLVAIFSAVTAQGMVDQSVVEGASGTDVVFVTLARITNANIFPDDERLLRRMAHAASSDGNSPITFRPDYFGGIWQVDEDLFEVTQDLSNPLLAGQNGYFDKIADTLLLDWTLILWRDLRIPLISALAAQLFVSLNTQTSPIPNIGNVPAQGQLLVDIGFRSTGDVENFVLAVTALELEGKGYYHDCSYYIHAVTELATVF